MKSPDGQEDYHYILTGGLVNPPPNVYHRLLATIVRTSFLKVLESDEKSWLLKVVSDRPEDPHGMIEIRLIPHSHLENGSRLYVKVNDEDFLKAFYGGGQLAKYAAGTLIGLFGESIRQGSISAAFE